MADFSVEFHRPAADAQWNHATLYSVFFRGLNDQLKDELVSLAIRIDNNLCERHWGKASHSHNFPPVHPSPIISLKAFNC